MHPTSAAKTDFRRVRDFGEIFSVSFSFVREHFKPLALGVLYIGGPFLLVGAGVLTLMVVRMVGVMSANGPDGTADMAADFIVTYVVNIGSLLTGVVMVTAVVNGYIRLYMESPEARPVIGVPELWRQVRRDFWWLAGRFGLLAVAALLYFGALVALGVFIFSSRTSFGLKFFVGTLYAFGFLFAAMCFYVYGYGLFPTQSYFERTSPAGSLARLNHLVRGQWWKTFGVVFIGGIIQGVAAGILYMPFYFILIFAGLFSVAQGGPVNTTLLTVAGVGMSVGVALGYALSYILHFVMQAFQYFSLLETKESTGLLAKIGNLGVERPAPPAADFYGEEEKF